MNRIIGKRGAITSGSLLLVGLLLVFAFLGGSYMLSKQTQFTAVQQAVTEAVSAAGERVVCPTDTGELPVTARAVNNLNRSYQQQASTFAVADSSGFIVHTGTGGSGSTVTFADLNLTCTEATLTEPMAIYALAGTAIGSSKASADFKNSQRLGFQVTLDVPDEIRLTAVLRNSTDFTNISTSAVGFIDQTIATAVTTQGTFNGVLDLEVATSNAQYGSVDGGLLFVIDNNNSAAFAQNDIIINAPSGYTLTSLSGAECGAKFPNTFNRFNGDWCYTGPAIKSTDGLLRFSYRGTASVADPTADPTIWIKSIHYGQDTDARVILEGSDRGQTNIGAAAVQVVIDLA